MIPKECIDLFFTRFEKRGDDKCWEWKGFKNEHGYGRMKVKGRGWLSNRLSWLIHKGEIKKGLCVCHSCDNPGCVNPNHLWLGTHKENMKDRTSKGRANRPFGTKSVTAKLNVNDVLAIRYLYRNEGKGLSVLGRKYKVSPSQIQQIVRGKHWPHVPMEMSETCF